MHWFYGVLIQAVEAKNHITNLQGLAKRHNLMLIKEERRLLRIALF
jgi:hypothetical protein